MKIETDYIERELFYLSAKDDWQSELPKDNWCLILLANTSEERLLNEIIGESITKNVGYICGIGKQQDYIHNQSDSEYVMREIGESSFAKPKYHIITVGDDGLDEGLWFGLNLTFNEDVEIERILIFDSDCHWKNEIEELINKFEKGYIPS